jgi:glucose-1-phosphate thymidylyltransferase
LEKRQGLQAGSPDEIAYDMGWIDGAALGELAEKYKKNDYGRYLRNLKLAHD